jgi:hypothetical protein
VTFSRTEGDLCLVSNICLTPYLVTVRKFHHWKHGYKIKSEILIFKMSLFRNLNLGIIKALFELM